MRFFRKKHCAVKNWHARAMLIDPKKTKLTIIGSKVPKPAPAWAYEKYVQQRFATK